MKKISVKNFKGEEFEGMWNEKTYSSKTEDLTFIAFIWTANPFMSKRKSLRKLLSI